MPEYGKIMSENPPTKAAKTLYPASQLKTVARISLFVAALMAVLVILTIVLPAR
jgi:hypothetical protein